ncbi:MAG: hypothetical protein D3926_13445 [Desulfobacteraceae bacterium]|nr:MAG: hypothetical protein D3926_13445 [Desulfobacteraceae bacterium]
MIFLNTTIRQHRLNYGVIVLVLILFNACSGTKLNTQRTLVEPSTVSSYRVDPEQEKVDALAADLIRMAAPHTRSASHTATEARLMAKTAITYSRDLAGKYQIIRPPLLHNILVRMGLKERGLCYHFADDLMARMKTLELKDFKLRHGVAFEGSDIKEHNSLVVTPTGRPFSEGMVLDPWRNSGELYWATVEQDTYPWEERR